MAEFNDKRKGKNDKNINDSNHRDKKLEIRLARVTLYIICHNTSGTSSHLSHSTDICRFVQFLWIIIGFSPWMNHLNNTFANCFRATPFL